MNSVTLRWLSSALGNRKRYIVYLTLVQMLHGGSGVLYALFLKRIVDTATAKDQDGFISSVLLTAALIAGQLMLRAVMRWLNELARAEFENTLKERLTAALLQKDYLRVSSVHSGEWMNRLTNDTVVIANGCVDIVPGLSGMAVRLISALIMIIALEPVFAAVFIPMGVLLAVFSWIFRRSLRRMHGDIQEADGKLRIFLQENIGNMLVVRSFAAEDSVLSSARQKMAEHESARMRRNRFSNICNIGFGAAMNGVYLLGAAVCGYGILKDTVSFGTLTAVTQLISQIQTPIVNITGYIPRYHAVMSSAERLMEAEAFEDGPSDAMTEDQIADLYENGLSAIGLDDVSFGYYPVSEGTSADGDAGKIPEVIRNMSLEIRKGEYVAFTGQSGCGKSTVLKLLMCVFSPDSGRRYFLDNEGNRTDLTGSYRRLFAYVPQNNALMNGTIREAVSFGAPQYAGDAQRLDEALKISCADGFVSQLDDGPDTLLGERGTGLSEGQMQRLAVARAVFTGSPVILLDEATSALDSATEKQLLENLRKMTDRTVVIVTHRPAALSICDRVLEFTEDGILGK